MTTASMQNLCLCNPKTHTTCRLLTTTNTIFTDTRKCVIPHGLSPSTSTKLRIKSRSLKHTNFFIHAHNSSDGGGESSTSLKIAIIGFGNFGQFIAKALRRQGHSVLATSRSDYSDYCHQNGINFFKSVDEMCDEQPDVILVCSSILSTENVVRGIPMHKLKPDTIFADVLSVKQFPRNLFFEVLPPGFGIVCTHPMFGPESGKNGWAGLPFVYDKVRIAESTTQHRKCDHFLGVFEQEGCRMVEMSCEEHDRHAAGSQFITHTIGRILSHLDLESTPINTKGYETLLQLTENTVSDGFDLYYGLFMYNVNATEQIENLDRAFETVKQKLFGRLHDILRKQIIERVPLHPPSSNDNKPYFLSSAEKIKDFSSFAMPASNQREEAAVCTPRFAAPKPTIGKVDLVLDNTEIERDVLGITGSTWMELCPLFDVFSMRH